MLGLKIDFSSLSTEAQRASLGTHDLLLATKYIDSNGDTHIRASDVGFTIVVSCDLASYSPYTPSGYPCPGTDYDFCADNWMTNGPQGETCVDFDSCLAGVGDGTGFDDQGACCDVSC